MRSMRLGKQRNIRYCSGKIGYIHFADNNRKYPGAGHLDFKKIIQAINDTGYEGFISVECLAQPSGEEAARLAMLNIWNTGNIRNKNY